MTIEDVLTLTIDYVDFDDFLNRLLKTIEVTFQSSELLDFQSRLLNLLLLKTINLSTGPILNAQSI